MPDGAIPSRDEFVPGADLSGRDLSGRDLSGLDLTGIKLAGADLSRATLINCLMMGADLSGATLFEADLSKAELLGAQLIGADLKHADVTGASFGGADLSRASLFGATCENTTFSQANLAGADFRTAHADKARFVSCDLSGTDFRACQLGGADFTSSTMHHACFDEAHLADARLDRVHAFTKSTWIDADTHSARFAGALALRRHIADENYLHELRVGSKKGALVFWLWWATSDCGRSFSRWGLLTMLVMLVYAWAYTQVAIDYGDYETFLSPIYYSVVTLTSLGYGDVLPQTGPAQVVAMSEAVVGYTLLGGMISILSNKIARRAD